VNKVSSLSCISLISADPHSLARFYCHAFGFAAERTFHVEDAACGLLAGSLQGAADIVSLRLGLQQIELIGPIPSGRAYPPDVSGKSYIFQHFAIVTADLGEAYERLRREPDWTSISSQGPQRLPAASGGVTAFKFRDPEGHPLELIEFPPGPMSSRWHAARNEQICLGIDHSAISVADTKRSIAFYEALGLAQSGGSLNQGEEQSRLDGIADATVEVTSLAIPACAPPHVELLCYRDTPPYRSSRVPLPSPAVNDVAATQLVFSMKEESIISDLCERHRRAHIFGPVVCDDKVLALLRDPDGHLIRIEASV
jgi:catechol 2,3-dioxygenase-like lactoylglutathione lyase family enzyme